MLSRYQQGFARCNVAPTAKGVIRARNEDFQVEEHLGFEPSGEGEHCFLHIRKKGENTESVARLLARHAGVPARLVSYSGLKDRNAVTTQWFSVHLPKRSAVEWSALNSPSMEVLEQTWHARKLRRGVHKKNHFRIVLSSLKGEQSDIETRLQYIKNMGVPNYFGEQRFGYEGNNLAVAEKLLSVGDKSIKRHQRGLYYSSARSLLFNSILSERIKENCWASLVPGDLVTLDGSNSFFPFDERDETTLQRVADKILHPTAPLWGRGDKYSVQDALAFEQKVLEDFPLICQGLEKAGLEVHRRALRLVVDKLDWEFECNTDGSQLVMDFELNTGGFATSVLREVINYSSV